MTLTSIIAIAVALVLVAMIVRALRKATGLLLVVLGLLACLTGVGFIFGVPLIFVGGVLSFI